MNPIQIYNRFGYYDEKRVYHLDSRIQYVKCVNPAPPTVVPAHYGPEQTILLDSEVVELSPVRLGGGTGVNHWAGKCRICGKIYISAR